MVKIPSAKVEKNKQVMMLSIRGLYQILAYMYEMPGLRTIQKGKLLFPIFFSHRLQPFSYYFHNSPEIKHFFPSTLR